MDALVKGAPNSILTLINHYCINAEALLHNHLRQFAREEDTSGGSEPQFYGHCINNTKQDVALPRFHTVADGGTSTKMLILFSLQFAFPHRPVQTDQCH